MIEQFIKFSVVGGSGVFVDFGLTFFLKERVKLNRYISNTIGFLSAATTNYFLNRWWTFQSSNPQIEREYTTFLLIAIAGLVINTIILHIFSEKIKLSFFPKKEKYRFYVAKFIATVVVTLWNFFLNYYITFSKYSSI